MKTLNKLFGRWSGMVFLGGALSLPTVASAETFVMTPDDDYTILENAQAGDVVEIAPGTYQFRVHLSQVGTPENPIIIRAQDPNNRPVWDLVGDSEATFVNNWPGSYGGGDNHRGCWQVASEGAYYEISGIVFQNCRAPSSAGIRMINSGPVTIRDALFQYNTNGLTGASTDLVVEHSEFFQNGKTLTEGNATHHIYIFGGRFALRYSYLHDGHEGQSFHVRARESLIEYNWITRSANYVGDIMSCENFCGDAPHQQSMLVRGNVIVQGMPANGSQLFALFRDADPDPNARMELTLLYNTIIGTPRAGTHNLVNLRNDTVSAYVHAFNNIIYDVGTVAAAASPAEGNWGLDGAGNWFSTDTLGTDGLTDSLFGADPGFSDVGAEDYTLVASGDAVGAAIPGIDGAPDREYYLNEQLNRLWRPRATALDVGAFESGTDSQPVGPYGEPEQPDDPIDMDGGAPDDEDEEFDGGTTDPTDDDVADDDNPDDDVADDDDTPVDDDTMDDDAPVDDITDDEDESPDDPAPSGDDPADDSPEGNAGSSGMADSGLSPRADSDGGCDCRVLSERGSTQDASRWAFAGALFLAFAMFSRRK